MAISVIASLGAYSVNGNGDTVPSLGFIITSSSPISVNGDAELASVATSGNGVAGDPYIIENLYISADGDSSAISIRNTAAHFVIRCCLLRGASEVGIYLDHSSNGTLEMNNCTDSRCGIFLNEANNNIVRNNLCSRNDRYGIETYSSNNNTLVNNTCEENGEIGIYIVISNRDTKVANNTCNENALCGIYLSQTNRRINVSSNNCSGNGYYGICLMSSSWNTIGFNTITGNLKYGIAVTWLSKFNLIYGNTIMNNNGATGVYAPTHVQANDTETNYWNSSSFGNYWGDWTAPDVNGDGIVDSPYDVEGGANEDFYPLTEAPSTKLIITISSPADGDAIANGTVTIVWHNGNPLSSVSYFEISVDDGAPIQIPAGTTSHGLTELITGPHTIVVRAVGYDGGTATDSVTFTVDASASENAGSPSNGGMDVVIISSVAIVLLVGAVGALYLHRRKN